MDFVGLVNLPSRDSIYVKHDQTFHELQSNLHKKISSYHPQTNDQVEVTIKS